MLDKGSREGWLEGLTVGDSDLHIQSKCAFWELIVEKMERKLARWKSFHLER